MEPSPNHNHFSFSDWEDHLNKFESKTHEAIHNISEHDFSSSIWEDDFRESRFYTKTHNLVRWKSGKKIDTRLLTLLESFGEIYVDHHEFFKKVFHGKLHEEVFGKIGFALKRKKKMKKVKSMPRSMSMRAIGSRGIDDEIEGLRLERFKVRTPNVIIAGPDDDAQIETTQGSIRP